MKITYDKKTDAAYKLEQWQTVSEAARKTYLGKQLNEEQVAAVVRESRER